MLHLLYVCANCRLFYLYQFSVWFWHLYLVFERRLLRLKLLEDIPLSRVQIIHIRTVYCWPQSIHSSIPSRSIFLSLSGGPASLHVRLLLPVVTLALECPCQWLQLPWSYTDNVYYWFTLRLACFIEYLATPFELQAYVWIGVNEWGFIAQREQNKMFEASKIDNPHPRRMECRRNCRLKFVFIPANLPCTVMLRMCVVPYCHSPLALSISITPHHSSYRRIPFRSLR